MTGELSASTVVWIATAFREEHRQALDWLNEETGRETHFFGTEIQAVRIDDSAAAPLLKVVVQPNDWQKSVKRAAAAEGLTGRAASYVEFWTLLIERLHETHPGWTRRKSTAAIPQNWIDMPSPLSGTSINMSFAQGRRLRHELYIDPGDPDQSRAIFNALLEKREAVERSYGRPLEFEELPGKRACRIAEYREGEVTNRDRYEDFVRWFIDAGERVRRALDSFVSAQRTGRDPGPA